MDRRCRACAGQHRGGEGEQGAQPLRIGEREPGGAALAAAADQSAVPQAGQVLADRRLGQVQVVDQVPHPVLPGGEVLEQRESGRLGQGVEERGLGLVHVEERGRGFHRHRHAAIISMNGDEWEECGTGVLVATSVYVMCFMYVMYVEFFGDSPTRGRTVGVGGSGG